MRTRILILTIVFLVVMAIYGYLTPSIKTLVNGCSSTEDQMQYNKEELGCE